MVAVIGFDVAFPRSVTALLAESQRMPLQSAGRAASGGANLVFQKSAQAHVGTVAKYSFAHRHTLPVGEIPQQANTAASWTGAKGAQKGAQFGFPEKA
jgi:hypothetical protein